MDSRLQETETGKVKKKKKKNYVTLPTRPMKFQQTDNTGGRLKNFGDKKSFLLKIKILIHRVCETRELVSSSFALSSSIGILSQPLPLIGKNLARSTVLLPLNPVCFDDNIGIVKTDDAFIVFSPNPNANKQVVCKGITKSISTTIT